MYPRRTFPKCAHAGTLKVIKKSKNEINNLAGIMGSKSTMCDENTISVIIECAYFNPEAIHLA